MWVYVCACVNSVESQLCLLVNGNTNLQNQLSRSSSFSSMSQKHNCNKYLKIKTVCLSGRNIFFLKELWRWNLLVGSRSHGWFKLSLDLQVLLYLGHSNQERLRCAISLLISKQLLLFLNLFWVRPDLKYYNLISHLEFFSERVI